MGITFDHKIDENGGIIYLMSNNLIAGKVTFKLLQNEIMEIDHTEVDPIFAGKGFGKLLIDEAVVFAQKNKMKIYPTCDFAKKILKNH